MITARSRTKPASEVSNRKIESTTVTEATSKIPVSESNKRSKEPGPNVMQLEACRSRLHRLKKLREERVLRAHWQTITDSDSEAGQGVSRLSGSMVMQNWMTMCMLNYIHSLAKF